MNTNIKIAIILAITAIIITGMNIFFSPFWACERDGTSASWCARAVGGQITVTNQ